MPSAAFQYPLLICGAGHPSDCELHTCFQAISQEITRNTNQPSADAVALKKANRGSLAGRHTRVRRVSYANIMFGAPGPVQSVKHMLSMTGCPTAMELVWGNY